MESCVKMVAWRCAGFALQLVLLAVLLPAPAAFAKSPPDRILVAGPGLTAPIAITDAAALAGFNPWARGFIAWERGLGAAPPPAEQTYTASFYVGRGVGAPSLIYVLRYVPDPAAGAGLIYLPGPGEEWYGLNIGTILTGDSDHWNPNGRWQYATTAWDVLMERALSDHGDPLPSVPATASVTRSGPPIAGRPPLQRPWTVAVPVGSLMLGLAWKASRLRRRPPPPAHEATEA